MNSRRFTRHAVRGSLWADLSQVGTARQKMRNCEQSAVQGTDADLRQVGPRKTGRPGEDEWASVRRVGPAGLPNNANADVHPQAPRWVAALPHCVSLILNPRKKKNNAAQPLAATKGAQPALGAMGVPLALPVSS